MPSGARGVTWKHDEVVDLVDIWGEARVQNELQKNYRNMDIFQKVADGMSDRGHSRTAVECRTKCKALKQAYKRVKSHNSQSESNPRRCPFFEELDRIFAADASLAPLGALDSLGFQPACDCADLAAEAVSLPAFNSEENDVEPVACHPSHVIHATDPSSIDLGRPRFEGPIGFLQLHFNIS